MTSEVNVLRAVVGRPRAESERIDAERRGFELPVSELEAEPGQRRSESVDLDMPPMVTAAARRAAEAPPVWQIGSLRPSGLDEEPTRFGAQGDAEAVTPVNAEEAAPEASAATQTEDSARSKPNPWYARKLALA